MLNLEEKFMPQIYEHICHNYLICLHKEHVIEEH